MPSSTCSAGRTGTSRSAWARRTPTTSVSPSPPSRSSVRQRPAARSWEALSRLIPSPDVVLTMPVVRARGHDAGARTSGRCSPSIDGARSVGDLVDVSGAGQFTVVSTLATLIQRGLLVLRDEESPDHVSLVRRRQQLLAPLEGRRRSRPSSRPPAAAAAVGTRSCDRRAWSVPDASIPAAAGGPLSPAAPPLPAAPPATSRLRCAPAAAAAAPGLLPGAHDPAERRPTAARAVPAQARRRPPGAGTRTRLRAACRRSSAPASAPPCRRAWLRRSPVGGCDRHRRRGDRCRTRGRERHRT